MTTFVNFFGGAFFAGGFFGPGVEDAGGGSGKHYGKTKPKRQWQFQPWEAPKVWKKIKAVEKQKAKAESDIEAIQAELQAAQDRLDLAKLKATAQRLELQIIALQQDLEELRRIHQELEDEEAQLMLIISRLHE